jgi:hypothetical protein
MRSSSGARVGTIVDVDLKTGESFKWELAEPNLLAAEMIACSPALQSLYADALRSHPTILLLLLLLAWVGG